jgi:hypothetical protein
MNLQNPPETVAAEVEHNPPAWFEELLSGLSIRSQFVISGSIRDLYPLPQPGGVEFVSLDTAVWRALERRGYGALLVHDPVDGLRLHGDCDPGFEGVLRECGLNLGQVARTPVEMTTLVHTVATEGRLPIALMVDYASALVRDFDADTARLFMTMDKASRAPAPARPQGDWPYPARNPILWVVDRPGDIPDWFVARNASLRDLVVTLPDLTDRFAYVAQQARKLANHDTLPAPERKERLEQFAVSCEGMTMTDIRAVLDLAVAEGFGVERIGDALRSYRIGTTRNPWTSSIMRHRVRNAKPVLEHRVKGQARSVEKAYDILVRSVMGLSGAQTTNRGNRPRGVLFFVGPTGVGKTELAKAVTEVLFGDETAMQRFDMSEFMGEGSIARLIGPPPGAPGHENGGELINIVRARPFSVFLFDEIEKGHPRVLDAFLQILDDGRLTDTRGETGYFSEALIIFTSNVGIVGGDRSTNMGQNILPSDTNEILEEKLTKAVGNHFRYELRRPELMNRMGQNIVAFEFINPRSAAIIFKAVLQRVLGAIFEEHGVTVTLTEEAERQLLEACTDEIGDGGRGIGNRIETYFINPVARILFEREGETTLTVSAVRQEGRNTVLDCA